MRFLPSRGLKIWGHNTEFFEFSLCPHIFLTAAAAAFFLLCGTAAPLWAAQFGKYQLTGAVELETKQEREKTGDTRNDYSAFAHRYKFDLNSFVLSPRLLNYQLGLELEKGNTDTNGDSSSLDNLGYNARAELFPGRRISASLYGSRDSSANFTPQTSSTASTLVTQTNTLYGAVLNLNYPAFPTTIIYDENVTAGASGAQQIDRNIRRLQLNANKGFYGFKGAYAYGYTNTSDAVEQANNMVEHVATANLEKNFSDRLTFREDLRYSASTQEGRFQDITSHTVTQTADYTLTAQDEIVRFEATLRNLTATLPPAVGDAGRTFTIAKVDPTANTVTIKPTGTEKINGADRLILQTQFSEVTLISNGINWIIGARAGQGTVTGGQNIMNLNANSYLSYRPSHDFSNDSSLNLYYYNSGEEPGTNITASNSTNYRINPRWDMNASVNGSYANAGKTGSNSENLAAGLNYHREWSGWQLGLTQNAALNFDNQSTGPNRVNGNGGLGASPSRRFDWLKSNLSFQTQANKSASSEGGKTFTWQSSGTWLASVTEMLQVQSTLRYSKEDSRNDNILAVAATEGTTKIRPYDNISRTLGLDLSYNWQVLVREDKTVTLNGGAVFDRRESEAGGNPSQTDRNFFYSQMMLRYAPLRNMMITSSLRGEWDNNETETNDTATGALTASSTPRRVYVLENTVNFRLRKIILELQYNWRQEDGSMNPYSRQSFYFKATRPF